MCNENVLKVHIQEIDTGSQDLIQVKEKTCLIPGIPMINSEYHEAICRSPR
jgi:hypothetical protein